MRNVRKRARPLVWIAPVLLLAACDTSFEPIAEGSAALSVFGYLDASADTQWVRVMPIRPVATTGPDASDVTVTLEDLRTGRAVTDTPSVGGGGGGPPRRAPTSRPARCGR